MAQLKDVNDQLDLMETTEKNTINLANAAPQVDADGNVLDANGNVVVDPAGEVVDANGNVVVDANNNVVDASGNVVVDA